MERIVLYQLLSTGAPLLPREKWDRGALYRKTTCQP